MIERICEQCKKPEDFPANPGSELRPYGPGGTNICYDCAFNEGNRELQTQVENNFYGLLEANAEIAPQGIVAIGEPTGPRPFDLNELTKPLDSE